MILSFSPNSIRQRAILWTVVLAVSLSYLVFRIAFDDRPILNTNLLALLPASEQPEIIQQAEDQMMNAVERRIIFLLSSPDKTTALEAAVLYAAEIAETGLFVPQEQGFDQRGPEAFLENYRQYPTAVLSDKDRQYLEQNQVEELLNEKLASLYGPIDLKLLLPLEHDPLMVFSDGVMAHLPEAPVNLAMEMNIPYVNAEGVYHAILSVTLAESPYDGAYQGRLMARLEEISIAIAQEYPALQITRSGVVFHAEKGMRDGKSEISAMSSIALAGILLLFLFTFRSLKPFLVTLLIIATGILTSLAVSLVIFGQVYLITLVFGTSLIGISVDYALHYFAEKYRGGDVTAVTGLRHVLPGITLGCVTSIIGFAGLLLAPFPGLVQMALFCCVGLFVAYCGVVLYFPLLAKLDDRKYSPQVYAGVRKYILVLQRTLTRNNRLMLLTVVVLVIGGGLTKVEFGDDIRSLQNRSPELLRSDQTVREVLGVNQAAQFFLVSGTDENDMLERDARLLDHLEDLVAQGQLLSFSGVSRYIPSHRRQQDNKALILTALEAHPDVIMRKLSPLGVTAQQLADYGSALDRTDEGYLTVATLKDTVLGEIIAPLLLENHTSIVTLGGVTDTKALAALATQTSGATFIDRADLISGVFSTYRQSIILMTIIAYGLIIVLVIYRYGVRKAVSVILPLLLAVSLTLAVMGYMGTQITLFHVVSILLVMGICIDYTIFLAEIKEDALSVDGAMPTMIAISLSAATTIVSYGMLTFSSMPVVHDIGALISLGILFAFVFSTFSVDIPLQKGGKDRA